MATAAGGAEGEDALLEASGCPSTSASGSGAACGKAWGCRCPPGWPRGGRGWGSGGGREGVRRYSTNCSGLFLTEGGGDGEPGDLVHGSKGPAIGREAALECRSIACLLRGGGVAVVATGRNIGHAWTWHLAAIARGIMSSHSCADAFAVAVLIHSFDPGSITERLPFSSIEADPAREMGVQDETCWGSSCSSSPL